jgi:hypothetical protein
MPWTLEGALPAGDWHLTVQGYQPTMDAVVRADLEVGSHMIGTATASATAGAGVDGGFPGDFSTVIHADAVTPSCGDQLTLVLTLVSGGTPYNNIEAILTTP